MNRKDLANKIWNACDIMRRDDGTTGVLEYMEQISWMIFLKVFEAVEKRFEDEAKFSGKPYQPIIELSYRWSAWAEQEEKELAKYFSEDELKSVKRRNEHILIAFIDEKLFPYLKSMRGTTEKEKIAAIFQEIRGNRMKSPYNLKDVIILLNEIDFNNVEDSYILSQVYEELLLRLGREGGVAGEFYTPRPIVRLMTKIVEPKIGETILDPFCGSCGFLIESYNLMKGSKELTVEDYEKLQKETFYAQEKKPLPYLIGVMNCILHDILTPNIVRKNTLEEDIRNIPESQRFYVILTNPPFGGKENRQIQQNFPIKSQATELLALQYVMKKLKKDGRCGIVVPEGILFRGDAFAQVKKELLENYNLHTIISLPSGVFANVTSSGQGPKTNLLFFDKTGKAREIWYYEHLPSEGKNYTKANPITDEDLKDCYEKWKERKISDNSWIVPLDEVIKKGYDLTARNPNRKEDTEYETPEALYSSILEKEKQIIELLDELNETLNE
nr:class I SAM-dependent DNA methyltransferase [Candidatus Freyarchaeota archaeon]